MTINRTTLLDLPLPVTGTESGTWGDVTNNGLSQYVDIAVAGMNALTSSDFTAGALTISNTQGDSGGTNIAAGSAQYATIKVSSLATNSTITAPASNRSYRIVNLDSTYNLTIKASGQTGITFLPGQTGVVAFTGTDYEVVGVVNAASSTDNAVPKFDGTTGQIIQNTGVTIDDSNNVSGVAQLNATTADLTNIEVTNIKAKDGTSAGSIADSTGVVTLASSVLTTTDINGGTIDGAVIGGASAAAGSFTTLNTSGQVVFNDAGADVDFRVESDTVDHALFVEGSSGNVGIGTSSPGVRLDVTTATAGFAASLTNTNGASDSNGLYVKSGTVSTEYNLRLSNTSASTDFMVVKGNGNVGIGTSTPDRKLVVLDSVDNNLPAAVITKTGLTGANSGLQVHTNEASASGGSFGFRVTSGSTYDSPTNEIIRVNQHGLCFNGDTAAANALDDYEEADWTPVAIGGTTAGTGTYTLQVGRYTKIGQVCFFQMTLGWSAHTGTGDLILGGLPFTSLNAAGGGGQSVATLGYNNGLAFTNQPVMFISNNNTIINLSQTTTGGAISGIPMDTAVSELVVNGHYIVA
jgi:hypothetical protein